jgi:hypothetical protein
MSGKKGAIQAAQGPETATGAPPLISYSRMALFPEVVGPCLFLSGHVVNFLGKKIV